MRLWGKQGVDGKVKITFPYAFRISTLTELLTLLNISPLYISFEACVASGGINTQTHHQYLVSSAGLP